MAIDDFNRANNQSLGAPWTESESVPDAIQIITNELVLIIGAPFGLAYQSGFINDQSSKLVFRSLTNNPFSGPAVRVSGTSASGRAYAAIHSPFDGQVILNKWVDQDLSLAGTSLGTFAVVLVNGDIVFIQVIGNQITVKINGITRIGPITDTTITTGSPGAATGNQGYAGTGRWDDWVGLEAKTPTDSFDRANNLSLGVLWTEDESDAVNLQVLTNRLRMDVANIHNAFARRTEVYPDDQYAQMTWQAGAGAQQSGVIVRSSGPQTNFTGYVATWWTNNPGNALSLRSYVNTTHIGDSAGILLGSFTYNPVAGDVLKLEAIGTAIKVYVNGVERISVVSATIAAGLPGALVHSSAASTTDWDDFVATSLAPGGGGSPGPGKPPPRTPPRPRPRPGPRPRPRPGPQPRRGSSIPSRQPRRLTRPVR